MTEQIKLGPVHHVALRVTQLDRSIAFYQDLFGFQLVVALPDVTILSNGALILGLRDQGQVASGDRFDEFRVGLDHISFAVASRTDLDRAIQLLDQRDVPHGEIEDLGKDFGIYVLALRDPDNVQLELTAAYR
ncbi:MAG TPA: VOC family protein [Roseiflexaceae bacterium]|nr:VOC family protein [Roseiflexaceae bacterium]